MGKNPLSDQILGLLNLKANQLGRYRDVCIDENIDLIYVMTRNYESEYDDIDEMVSKHPCFVKKEQAGSDHTFQYYIFKVPPELKDKAKEFADLTDTTPPMTRYLQLMEDLKNNKDTESVRHAMEVGKKIMEPLKDVLDGKSADKVVSGPLGGKVHIKSVGSAFALDDDGTIAKQVTDAYNAFCRAAKEIMQGLKRDRLDSMQCATPGCTEDHGPMYLHSNCHSVDPPLARTYPDTGTVAIACSVCFQPLGIIEVFGNHEEKEYIPECHPDAGTEICYNKKDGTLTIECRECHENLKTFYVK